MGILNFFRRSKSRYADDKAVDAFSRVVEQTGILSEQQRIEELAKLISKDDPAPDDIERLGKLLSDK